MKLFSVAHTPPCLMVDLEVKNVDPAYCVQDTKRAARAIAQAGKATLRFKRA